MQKIRPSERMRKSQVTMERDGSEALLQLLTGAQEHALQTELEAEVDTFLARPWYQRSGAKRGYRNGYYPRTVTTPSQRLHLQVPRVRNTRERFTSWILKQIVQVTDRVHQVVTELYVRGLSTRDIELGLVDDSGRAICSRSSVSRIAQHLYAEYQTFSTRDLAHLDVVYLFLDGVYEAVRRYTNGQPLLCAWAICADGHKELLHLMPAASESADGWEAFCQDLQRRGLRQPLVTVTDGAPGLLAAIAKVFPRTDRQRCLAHKLRNIAQRLPKDRATGILLEVKAIFYAPDRPTADVLTTRFVETYAPQYPGAVQCFLDALEACLTHLKYPEAHRRFIRTTNLLERAFEEEKRRTKVLPQHQHERGAVGLIFGGLYRTSQQWRGVKMTTTELAQLRHIRAIMCPEAGESQFISFRTAA